MILVDVHGRLAVTTLPVFAAHSMDTTWYAVDREGEVARCNSGEEGSVPYAAHRAYWTEMLPELFVARLSSTLPDDPFSEAHALHRVLGTTQDPVERGLVKAILDGDTASGLVYADWLEANSRAYEGILRYRTVFQLERALRAIDPATLPEEWPGILVFADREHLEWFRDAFYAHSSEWRELDVELGMPHAVALSEIPNYAFETGWSCGNIVTAYWVDPWSVKPTDLGLYEYECSFRGPYHRSAVPKRPLLVDDLPERLRTRLSELRIAQMSFDRVTTLDPDRYADCHHYRLD